MASAGDESLLNRLVLEHLPEALRFAVRLTGRVDWAEEVVQEALYRAAKSLHTFRARSQFRTWFFRIVITAFRDQLAFSGRAANNGQLTEDIADPHGADPAARLLADELRTLIAQRVSALPPRQREVLILIAYEQMSVPEVARVLEISEANVHVNLHHARAKLRADLAPYLAEK